MTTLAGRTLTDVNGLMQDLFQVMFQFTDIQHPMGFQLDFDPSRFGTDTP